MKKYGHERNENEDEKSIRNERRMKYVGVVHTTQGKEMHMHNRGRVPAAGPFHAPLPHLLPTPLSRALQRGTPSRDVPGPRIRNTYEPTKKGQKHEKRKCRNSEMRETEKKLNHKRHTQT